MEIKVKANFSHSIITELNYKTNESDVIELESSEEVIFESIRGRTALHQDLEVCFVELITDINTTIDDNPNRSLELSMRFFFNLEIDNLEQLSIEESEEKIMEELHTKTEQSLMTFCRQQLRETIKQVTSIDNQGALITEGAVINF